VRENGCGRHGAQSGNIFSPRRLKAGIGITDAHIQHKIGFAFYQLKLQLL